MTGTSSSLQQIISQILGATGGTAGILPRRTSGNDFLSWLTKLLGPGASTPSPAPSGPPSDTSSLLASLMANAGKPSAPNSPLGAVVQPALPGTNLDPFTYGQTGGEATFYHTTPDAKFAPIAAMPGLGGSLAPSTSKKKK